MVSHPQTHEWQGKPRTAREKIRAKTGVTPARHRQLFKEPLSSNLLDRALAVLWPWRYREYPGIGRLRGWLLGGMPVKSADAYRFVDLPAHRARIVAGNLRAKASEVLGIAAELEAYADQRGRVIRPAGFASKRQAVVPPE